MQLEAFQLPVEYRNAAEWVKTHGTASVPGSNIRGEIVGRIHGQYTEPEEPPLTSLA